MTVPAPVRRAVDDAVVRSLRAALDARGLLLDRRAFDAATADVTRVGTALLRRVVGHCYRAELPGDGAGDVEFGAVEFGDARTARRIALALAFGSVTATLLAPPGRSVVDVRAAAPVGVVCAVFNLGVGLIDGLCDGVPEHGRRLLGVVEDANLVGAAREPWPARRLSSALPASLAADPTVAFTARIVEAFFELLHATYPGFEHRPLREHVGVLLQEAVDAERRSVDRGPGRTRDELTACSRSTSVLPFEIIEHLATGAAVTAAAGRRLGEAMWRVDDLVDLVPDAETGALNALLIAGSDAARPGPDPAGAALGRLLASPAIARTAEDAADLLDVAMGQAEVEGRLLFLSFVQRYAGITPA